MRRYSVIGEGAARIMVGSYDWSQFYAPQKRLLTQDGQLEHPQGDAERQKPAAERRDSALGGEEGEER